MIDISHTNNLSTQVTGYPLRVSKVDEVLLFCFVFFWASGKVNISFLEDFG